MKKALMSLIAAICMSCSGQWVITNYVYTVSNITHIVNNEITQNVNRVYNYYSTNFTINVETNLYVDTVIGTNIATNVEMTVTVNVTTNLTLYETNFTYQTHVHYHTTYETNVNTYIDTWQNVYQTNYVTEVTLTNFEGYVEQCETIISNGVDYISSLTNDLGDAMLYAYICNEAAQRLASTNAIAFATNSIPIADPNGYYDRLFQLACNNLNGSFMAIATSGQYATMIYAVRLRYMVIEGSSYVYKEILSLMQLSHIVQTSSGFEVIYLPLKEYRRLYKLNNKYIIPSKMSWVYNGASNVLEVLEFDSEKNFISKYEVTREAMLYPNSWGENVSDSAITTSSSQWYQMSPTIHIDDGLVGNVVEYYKTSSQSPHTDRVFAPMFPSLDEWRYMWWIVNTTGEHMR